MAISLIDTLDIGMFSVAQSYDLSRKEERQRSVSNLENLFFRTIRELKPDVFIEAGAKDGGTSRRARTYLPDAKITAFEANPYTYERFAPSFKDKSDGVTYLHRALSDADGQVTFNVRVFGGKPSADGQGSMLKSQEATADSKAVTVAASRLDSHFKPASFDRCAIWMDVEGAYEMVLKGGKGILNKIDALFIEVEDRSTKQGQWLAGNVMDYLADFDLMPLARDFQTRYQYNVLFLNRRNLRNDRVRLFFAEFLSAARFGAPKPATV